MEKKRVGIIFFIILLLGLIVRIFLVDKIIVGDLLSYMEWGRGFWEWRNLNFYFGDHMWGYSSPNYPPLGILIFAGLDYLWQHKYLTAQLHNLIKFPPSFFIIYFYKYGNILLLKLISIISDLVLGGVVYTLVFRLTKNYKKALLSLAFFVLNPITIFISGGWGQTDSLVAVFGTLAFFSIYNKKPHFGIPLFMIGLLIKPSWGILLPFFIYYLYFTKSSIKQIVVGLSVSIFIFIIVTIPFSGKDVIFFSQKLWLEKLLLPIRSTEKVSISAFNFYTIFSKIDRDFANGFLKFISYSSFILVNVFAIRSLKVSKDKLLGLIQGIYIVGLGSFLFMTGMLERYFYPAFAPLVIISITDFKYFKKCLVICLVLLLNIFWSFFRRGSDEIDHPFTGNNFLLIKILSLVIVYYFTQITSKMLQFKRD